jgi:outer membrane protein
MNKMIRTLLTVAALATGSAAFAQPAVKLVTVDIAKTYDAYWKAQEGMAKFQDAQQKAQEQAQEYQKQGQLLVDEYKELVEQSKSAMLTPDAKTKAEQNAQKKMEEIQRKQQELQNFLQTTDRSLQQQMLTRRELLLEEITKTVKDIAKRKGATLVLDKSGPSGFRIPVVLDADAAYEITDEVIAEINKDKPATAPAAPTVPAATPKLSGPAAPASSTPAPTFTVPNVSAPTPTPAKKP